MKFGVFDSGIGGVTVLQALRKQFPGVRFAYFGDTAHVPYGTKSATQIRALSESAAKRIRAEGVDALIVACNTASSLALSEIAAVLGKTPVYGMVEAGVRAVEKAAAENFGPIVVFGTRATVRSHVYAQSLASVLPGREVIEQACPLLVPMIEEGWVRHPVLAQTLREYVLPYLQKDPGVALLACTHYPWIRDSFERALPGWTVIDSADAVSARLLEDSGKFGLRVEESRVVDDSAVGGVVDDSAAAAVEWFFSDPEVAGFIFEGAPPEIRGF